MTAQDTFLEELRTMPAMTTADLLITLRALHLLTPAQSDTLTAMKAHVPDLHTFAKKLVSDAWLTPFQVNQVLQGHGQNLLLGPYVLIERLGEGGMGEVYKAKNWKMSRIVALKIIRKDRLQSETIVSRFYREVRAASQLSHPNIITAFDAGQAGPTHYFAMEYVQGIDLAQLVKQAGPLSIAQACDYIRQAALGLQHAYQRGLVHRDIKPSNLLVTGIVDRGALVARKDQPPLSTHVVKILDMGLARMADNDDSIGTLTEEGSVLGTLDYLSPEQAMNAHQADIRSDLYSLGCTFYFLLTGQAAHGGGTATEKLLRHRLEEPEPVERLRPEVPAPVAAVVRKLMAKQPEDRYQTPAELAAALAGGPNRIQVPASPAGGRAIAPLRLPSVPTAGNGPDTDPTEVQPTSLGSARRSAAGKFLWVGGGLALTLGACLLGALLLLNRKEEKAAQPGMATASGPATALRYVKKATRDETVLATLQGNGLPTLAGTWYGIGYFEALGGVEAVHPFEKQLSPGEKIDPSKAYVGKGGNPVSWKECPQFSMGKFAVLCDLVPGDESRSVSYLYHEFSINEPIDLPVTWNSEAASVVWHNGERVHRQTSVQRGASDRPSVFTIRCRPGSNKLLLKLWSMFPKTKIFLCPRWPAKLENQFEAQLKQDFPQ